MVAARAGADPAMNARLRAAVEGAKKASMPRDAAPRRAIKKGAGLLDDGATYETVTYEGFAPHQVPVIVECLTDNKNRTATNMRHLFRNGQMGAVAWDFTHVGIVDATPPPRLPIQRQPRSKHQPGLRARRRKARFRFYTEPAGSRRRQQGALGAQLDCRDDAARPGTPRTRRSSTTRRVQKSKKFLAELDEDDDVQHIYVGLDT